MSCWHRAVAVGTFTGHLQGVFVPGTCTGHLHRGLLAGVPPGTRSLSLPSWEGCGQQQQRQQRAQGGGWEPLEQVIKAVLSVCLHAGENTPNYPAESAGREELPRSQSRNEVERRARPGAGRN